MPSIRIHIHNESAQPLELRERGADGDWVVAPPDRVPPGTTTMALVESENIFRGCEGTATYAAGADQVTLRCTNPRIGRNTYSTHAGSGHHSFVDGSGGSEAVAHLTVRTAGLVSTDFRPSRDAWRFRNKWGDAPYTLPGLEGTLLDQRYGNAGNGLCGGMVFGALDYFYAERQIPMDAMAPPDDQDPLFRYLVRRLFATFDPASVSLMVALTNDAYPDADDEGLSAIGLASSRAAVMAREEWPLIRADIDAGRPSPVFVQTGQSLVPFAALGQCHQVLAYAYDVSGDDVVLHVYDPNTPPGEGLAASDGVTMAFNIRRTDQPIRVTSNINVKDGDRLRPVRCFARMNYGPPDALPIDTAPRLSASDRARRRVAVQQGPTEVVSRRDGERGRRTFPVWPDCGEQTFAYTVVHRAERTSFSATTRGYAAPVLRWWVGGEQVNEGTGEVVLPRKRVYVARTNAELKAPAATPGGRPEHFPRGRVERRTVRLATTLEGGVLRVTTRPEDGVFSVGVTVAAGEPGEPLEPDGRAQDVRRLQLDITGWEEVVQGWAEAMGSCLQSYLDARRDGLPQLRAEIDALRASMHRPGNPLWDPDPVMRDIAAAQRDPVRELVTTDLAQVGRLITTELERVAPDGLDLGAVKFDPAGLQIDVSTIPGFG